MIQKANVKTELSSLPAQTKLMPLRYNIALMIKTECLAFRIRVLSRVVTNLYDKWLRPLGITANQTTILAMLSLVGKASPGDVCKALVMEKSTVSRNLDRMKKKGWIAVAGRSEGNTITVTPEGQELLVAMHDRWQSAQAEVARLLGDDGINSVLAIHETLRVTTHSV